MIHHIVQLVICWIGRIFVSSEAEINFKTYQNPCGDHLVMTFVKNSKKFIFCHDTLEQQLLQQLQQPSCNKLVCRATLF
jgi:hypothetical protein